MILRFFVFIWGAFLATLLLVALLIFTLDGSVPEPALRAIEKERVHRQLSQIALAKGVDGAFEVWLLIAPIHENLVVAFDPTCGATEVIQGSGGKCLSLEQISAPPPILFKIGPFIVPLALGAFTSAIAAILLSRWLTRPIRTVSSGLKALAGGALSTRIQPDMNTSNPELARLAAAFDNAAARLQELTENRQQLFHDISHEIRSPLARLRAAIGLAEKSPQRAETMLGRMTTDIGRLDHLVDEILTLARFEKGQLAANLERLDFLDIIEPIIGDANFEGQQNDVTLRYEGVEKMELVGNAELLHRAFENIIRNALAYSPRGGEVIISGKSNSSQIELTISDEGPGVAEADLKALFAPFVRLGEAERSTGVGLGLAIAASAIEAVKGEISALNRPGGGLIIQVSIPITKEMNA